MQPCRHLFPIAALAAALSLAVARPCAAQIAPNLLNLPFGYTRGRGSAVNAGGQVAGSVDNDTTWAQDACVWTNGVPVLLPEPDGHADAAAVAINDRGVVVGYVDAGSTSLRAVRWTPRTDGSYTAEDLGALHDDDMSEAVAVNNQGQILCRNITRVYNVTWFLWEDGVRTEITTPGGEPIDPSREGTDEGMLCSNGRVAGNAHGQAVLWQKTSSGVTVTHLTLPGPYTPDGPSAPFADAASANGVVAGRYVTAEGYIAFFVYDPNATNRPYTCADTGPASNGSVRYYLDEIVSVNDQGQILAMLVARDTLSSGCTNQLWIWQAGTGAWTQVPLDGLTSIPIPAVYGVINNYGQVAGNAIASAPGGGVTSIGFGWSAETGTQQLSPSGDSQAIPVALNESGLAAGLATWNGGYNQVPVTWSLPLPVTISVPSPSSGNVTVTIPLRDPSATDTACDVTVISATLGGQPTTSALPFVYGAIKPGASKQCTLHFKNVPSGVQTLTISGTSSLGDFSITQTVTVP